MSLQRRSKTHNSSSYIGSGNQVSVFNRRPKKPFGKIRRIYGEHIIGETGIFDNSAYGNLSETEKLRARNHVQSIIDKEKKRQFYNYVGYAVLIISVIILTIVIMN